MRKRPLGKRIQRSRLSQVAGARMVLARASIINAAHLDHTGSRACAEAPVGWKSSWLKNGYLIHSMHLSGDSTIPVIPRNKWAYFRG